ncbi:MAG: peptide chain release factor N(5)-glutamine methyltransferase [Rhodospirillales bacterium]|jgi:release factor glutamine methyltransferase
MLNIQEALNQSNAFLAQAGIETARLDARLLVEYSLGLGSHESSLKSEGILQDEEYQRLQTLVTRRAKREPLAYIITEREFWSLPFKVSPATLVPRPDSETLIEAALEYVLERNDALTVLDLGTGSGCLLLSLLHELPHATGVGIDRCPEALKVARYNANQLSLSGRASFVCADWCNGLSASYDVVLCNPPYISNDELATLMPEVAQYEPHHALSGGVDGLESYRAVASLISDVLSDQGKVIFEIGMNQVADVSQLLIQNNLQVIDIKKDLSGLPRCIVAQSSRSKIF